MLHVELEGEGHQGLHVGPLVGLQGRLLGQVAVEGHLEKEPEEREDHFVLGQAGPEGHFLLGQAGQEGHFLLGQAGQEDHFLPERVEQEGYFLPERVGPEGHFLPGQKAAQVVRL